MKRVPFKPAGVLALEASSYGAEFAPTDGPKKDLFAQVGTLGIVEISGPLLQNVDKVGCWDSYEAIRTRVAAALASAVDTLVLRINSPGGEVAGCFELADEILVKAKAAGKRVVAYVDGMAASAAYALACTADAIYVPPTGLVGSIGCIKVAVDQTGLDRQMGLTFAVVASGGRKADGNPHVAISEATIGALQTEVNAMADIFFGLVARSRGMAPTAVAALDAGMFLGASAVTAGLADAVDTFDGLLAKLAAGKATARQGAEEEMNEKEKAIAALKALAASKDEKEAAGAKAALKAMGVEEGEKPADDKGEDKGGEKSEGGEPPAKDGEEKKDGDDKDKDKGDAKASLALAAKVQDLTAKWQAKEEAEERAKLMATRPDFAPEVVALMERSPIGVLRDAVKNLPKGAAPKGGPIAAARAALTVAPTQGKDAGEHVDGLPAAEARELDERMGLVKRTNAIRLEGTKHLLGVMTPAEARAEIAKRDEIARKGATK